jgi:charged multivesicular body protein 3
MTELLKKVFGGSEKPPEEQAKQWKRQLASEMRKIDGQIRKIQLAEKKCVQSAKQAAKKNDQVAVRMLAKEILHSRKAVNRLCTARAQMNSVGLQLQHQMSQLKLSGCLSKSTEVMRQMNDLMKVGEVQAVMRGLSMEMTKAGLIDEMVSETLDSALDDVEDEELDDEVSKVVEEVVHGQMEGARVGAARLPQKAQEAQQEAPAEEDDDQLMAKYNALKS